MEILKTVYSARVCMKVQVFRSFNALRVPNDYSNECEQQHFHRRMISNLGFICSSLSRMGVLFVIWMDGKKIWTPFGLPFLFASFFLFLVMPGQLSAVLVKKIKNNSKIIIRLLLLIIITN